MTDRPKPVPDLDWSPERARAFGEGALDVWEEMLVRLRELPVARRATEADVHRAVAIDVPEGPMTAAIPT